METVETLQTTPPVEQRFIDWTKIILAAVLGFGLLAASAYAGYYYGTQQVQPVEKPTPVVSQPQPEADRPLDETPEPTSPVEEPTADWGEYTNPKYNFYFSYEPDSELELFTCSNYGEVPAIGYERHILYEAPTQPTEDPAAICHTQGEGHIITIQSEREKEDCKSTGSWAASESTTQVAGVNVNKCEKRFVGERVLPGPNEIVTVSVPHPHRDDFVIIELKDVEFAKTFNQILSTFKFLE